MKIKREDLGGQSRTQQIKRGYCEISDIFSNLEAVVNLVKQHQQRNTSLSLKQWKASMMGLSF